MLASLGLFALIYGSQACAPTSVSQATSVNEQKLASINVMGPLVIGDPSAPEGESSAAAWAQFDAGLKTLRSIGVDAISTDVWWGLVEPRDDAFDWRYYDLLSTHIISAGLKWVPILSFHQCGGNVGDDCNVPIPSWIWSKLATNNKLADVSALKFKSEQRNDSNEYVSVWATRFVLDDYVQMMQAFQMQFAKKAASISEINVSLGPSGELRYPSYNAHDQGSGYPTRGALQSYSSLAVASFEQFAMTKYGSRADLQKAWGKDLARNGKVAPPAKPETFFASNAHRETQYGRDFFDWYGDSLNDHGLVIMTAALQTFNAKGAAFAGIDLGAKIPGIHWRIGRSDAKGVVLSDRLAELAAGLIRTSGKDWERDEDGRGYRPILTMFAGLEKVQPEARVVLHFTCLEMSDGQDRPEVQSLAHSLVNWVGAEARRQGIPLKGENALGWNLPNADAWKLMRSSLLLPSQKDGYYSGLTLLRMSDIIGNETATKELTETVRFVKAPRRY